MTSIALALLLLGGGAAKECHRGGCSGEVCSEKEGVLSTCEEKAEFACYRDAKCERQPDGKCGFTPSPQLAKCLAKARRQGT